MMKAIIWHQLAIICYNLHIVVTMLDIIITYSIETEHNTKQHETECTIIFIGVSLE